MLRYLTIPHHQEHETSIFDPTVIDIEELETAYPSSPISKDGPGNDSANDNLDQARDSSYNDAKEDICPYDFILSIGFLSPSSTSDLESDSTGATPNVNAIPSLVFGSPHIPRSCENLISVSLPPRRVPISSVVGVNDGESSNEITIYTTSLPDSSLYALLMDVYSDDEFVDRTGKGEGKEGRESGGRKEMGLLGVLNTPVDQEVFYPRHEMKKSRRKRVGSFQREREGGDEKKKLPSGWKRVDGEFFEHIWLTPFGECHRASIFSFLSNHAANLDCS